MPGSARMVTHIAHSLQDTGRDALVMGGNAVRYYGVDRNTVDFDLVTSVASPDELRSRLNAIPGFETLKEIPAWRRGDFARFDRLGATTSSTHFRCLHPLRFVRGLGGRRGNARLRS